VESWEMQLSVNCNTERDTSVFYLLPFLTMITFDLVEAVGYPTHTFPKKLICKTSTEFTYLSLKLSNDLLEAEVRVE